MPQVFENFQAVTVGEAPAGWTPFFTTPGSVSVQEAGAQKYLRVSRNNVNGQPQTVAWDAVGDVADVELFALIETPLPPANFTAFCGLVTRAQGAVGSETGWFAVLFAGSNIETRDWRINRYLAGVLSAPSGNRTTIAWEGSTVYGVRYRLTGSLLEGRIWVPAAPFTDPTADEPSTWPISFTNTGIPDAGKVGFGGYNESTMASNGSRLYAIGVGTEGDPAPSAPLGDPDPDPDPGPLDTDFTGANGSPWPAPFLTELPTGSSGGGHTLLDGWGVQRTHDQTWSTARATVGSFVAGDVGIETSFRLPTVGVQYGFLWLRADGWNQSSPWEAWSGYALYFDNTQILLEKYVGGVRSSLASGAATQARTWVANTEYAVKFEALGSTVRAKVWPAASAEPSDWDLQGTDFSLTSGEVRKSLLGGGSSGTRRWDFNYTRVVELEPDSPNVVDLSGVYRWDGTGLVPLKTYPASQVVAEAPAGTVLYDFNDGTVQGWVDGWVEAGDSVSVSNVANQLRVAGTTTRNRPGSLRMPAHDNGQLNSAADQGGGNFISAVVTLSPDAPAGEFGCDLAWQDSGYSWKTRFDTIHRRMDTGQVVNHLVPGVPCMVHVDFGTSDPIVNPRGVQVLPGSGWTDASSAYADVDDVRRSTVAPTISAGGGGGGSIDTSSNVLGWSGMDEHTGIRRDITASWANRESWDNLQNAQWFGHSPNGAWHWLQDGNYEKAIFLNIGLIPHNISPGYTDPTDRKARWDALFDEVIAGTRDGVYEGMGARLSDYGSRYVYCVLWWEMNEYENDVDVAKFKAAWARAVPIIRANFAARATSQGRTTQELHIVYAPMHSRTRSRWWDWLPDDPSLVDVIGCNVYAKEWFDNPPTKAQIETIVKDDLARIKTKADELGKRMALPEWATWSPTSGASAGQWSSRGLGDEPDVIDWYADWIIANNAIAAYFDIDHGDGVQWLNNVPLCKARMEQRFPRAT